MARDVLALRLARVAGWPVDAEAVGAGDVDGARATGGRVDVSQSRRVGRGRVVQGGRRGDALRGLVGHEVRRAVARDDRPPEGAVGRGRARGRSGVVGRLVIALRCGELCREGARLEGRRVGAALELHACEQEVVAEAGEEGVGLAEALDTGCQ